MNIEDLIGKRVNFLYRRAGVGSLGLHDVELVSITPVPEQPFVPEEPPFGSEVIVSGALGWNGTWAHNSVDGNPWEYEPVRVGYAGRIDRTWENLVEGAREKGGTLKLIERVETEIPLNPPAPQQIFWAGDTEPSLNEVKDNEGDIWTHDGGFGWRFNSVKLSWRDLVNEYGPLTRLSR